MEPTKQIKARLEELRIELRAERISYGELLELQSLSDYIESGDVELLESAGVPEFPEYPDEISIKWGVADFEDRASSREANNRHLKYNRSKFPHALSEMGRLHDCNNGITWDTVDYFLDEYCNL